MDYNLKSICANNIMIVNIVVSYKRGLRMPMRLLFPPHICICYNVFTTFHMHAGGADRTQMGRGQVASGCLARARDNAKNFQSIGKQQKARVGGAASH